MKTLKILPVLAVLFASIPMIAQDDTDATQIQGKLQSFTKYDFVPGDKIIFFDDFSQDAIGDFPALWTTDGSGEVRTVANFTGNWLYASSDDNVYCLMKNLALPQNFIFEFDVIPTPKDPDEDDTYASFGLTFFTSEDDFLQADIIPGTKGFAVAASTDGWTADGFEDGDYMSNLKSELAPVKLNIINHIILWIQGRRLRIYFDGQKVIDGTTALPASASYNRFRFTLWGHPSHPFFSNLKITTAAPDTRSKLLTEGKLISYGIYFDSGKDAVKPESYGAMNDIAKVLKENPDVRIRITGHTDSDGDDALNLDLSKRRAASVKKELSGTFGIDASRMETDGKGETQPIAPNTTAEGKAQNRRVEFLKL